MSDNELKQIMYALTVDVAECPAAVERVTAACGAIPQRGPNLKAQLAQCGGPDALLALWRELIASDETIAAYADEQWTKYVAATTAMPGPLTQAANAASAALAETAAIINKTPPVSTEEAERRFSICLGCEYLNQANQRCSQCGCFMRFKTAFRSAQCPVGKW